MKTSFKTLSLIFFISLMLLTFPLYSWAEEEASTQNKDIQMIDNPYEFGGNYDAEKADEYKIINVSVDDIKERLHKSEPVHFVEEQEESKRTIKAEWITSALKKEYGVEKIDIKNAIIIDDLDFRIEENLIYIEESNLEEDEIRKLEDRAFDEVFIISSSINIEHCQLQGNFEARHDYDSENTLIFEKSVTFEDSKFVKEVDFSSTFFNGVVDFTLTVFDATVFFTGASFNGDADFWFASFNSGVNFDQTDFYDVVSFKEVSFTGIANFGFARFNNENEAVSFQEASFNGVADLSDTIFDGAAVFDNARFYREAKFFSSKFYGRADFGSTYFNGKVDLQGTSFIGRAGFRSTYFNEKVDFGGISKSSEQTSFNGVADFGSAYFNEKVDFNANFNSKVYFNETSFNKIAVFTRASFLLNIDFRSTDYSTIRISWNQLVGHLDAFLYGEETLVKLLRSSLSEKFPRNLRYVIRYENPRTDDKNMIINGKLSDEERKVLQELTNVRQYKNAIEELFQKSKDKDGGIFNNLDKFEKTVNKRNYTEKLQDRKLLDSLNIQNFTMWKQVYLRLIKNFEDLGDKKSADDAYYHYRSVKPIFHYEVDLESGNEYITGRYLWKERIEYIFLNLPCGYGTKPLRPLGVGGMLVLLFTLGYFIPYFFNVKSLVYRQGKDKAENEEDDRWYHCLYNSFYFSVMTFTTVGYGDYSPKRIFKVVAMLEGIFGWLTLALFLVTLGNVWLR